MPLLLMTPDVPPSLPQRTQPTRGGNSANRIVVVLSVALLAGGALFVYPEFKKVRETTQDKAVLGNIRQLAVAADQYYLENGVTSVAFSSLVGPTNFVKHVNAVDGESYPTVFRRGQVITVTGIAGARTVTYAP